MFVSQMAFHAQISDPAIGGTYMTLLNTVANLGTCSVSTCVSVCVDLGRIEWGGTQNLRPKTKKSLLLILHPFRELGSVANNAHTRSTIPSRV